MHLRRLIKASLSAFGRNYHYHAVQTENVVNSVSFDVCYDVNYKMKILYQPWARVMVYLFGVFLCYVQYAFHQVPVNKELECGSYH